MSFKTSVPNTRTNVPKQHAKQPKKRAPEPKNKKRAEEQESVPRSVSRAQESELKSMI